MVHRDAKQRAPRLKRRRIAHIPGYIPEAEMAEQLGVAVRTLRKWRQQGLGPAYTKFGKQVHYRSASRDTWLRRQEIEPVRSAEARVGV
jgi:phage terminase Nu1 subunit (DNA packaging protein)